MLVLFMHRQISGREMLSMTKGPLASIAALNTVLGLLSAKPVASRSRIWLLGSKMVWIETEFPLSLARR